MNPTYQPAPDTLNAAIYDVFKASPGEDISTEQMITRIKANGVSIDKPNSVSASMSTLRSDRHRTGIIRTAPGFYRYAPDELHLDTGDGAPRISGGSIAPDVIEALKQRGQATSVELDEALPQFTRKQITQVLNSQHHKDDSGVDRVANGVYRWVGIGGKTPNPNGQTSGRAVDPELAPVLDAITPQAFETVGLRAVGRTQDGDFICIDEQDTAWRVTVGITSRLL